MSKTKRIVTSEYVSYGHPDKIADQISDALLDEYVSKDTNTRAGIETMIKGNIVVLGGEVKTNAEIDTENIVRKVMDNINYPKSHKLSGKDIKIINLIGEQSNEISNGVDKTDCNCIGAGDQGFVVGFASDETKEYLPLGVYVARQICKAIDMLEGLGPDVKTQVSVEYGARLPKITTIVVSTMHLPNISIDTVRDAVLTAIKTNHVGMNNVMDDNIFTTYIKDNDNIDFHINENGTWNIGGSIADCGLTGRKIVVDQYGGYCNVGGGALSGKCLTKVDRSGAYMCRYIAKNIVDAGLASDAKVELSYIISKPNPYAVNVTLTNPISTPITDLSRQVEKFITDNIDLSPNGIIDRFFPCGIKPIFYNTARNGHYGYNNNDEWYPWEKTDISDKLKEYIEETELKLLED